MALNQRTSFERSLDLFRREISDHQIKQMAGVNQRTLVDTIQEVQKKLGRQNSLCGLTRIQRFLHAMEHIEKLVTIFLNASDFVAFIWGPIKLALMVATTWTDATKHLIDAYEEIAEALGNLAFFHNLIKSTNHLKLVLEDYFADILQFHRCVLDVFSRPGYKRVFKWAWGAFRHEVKPILESLKQKQRLLSDDKLRSHAILKEVQDSHQYVKDQFSNLHTTLEDIRSVLASEQSRNKTLQAQEMKTYLESRLDVSKHRIELQLESRHPIHKDSGNWIFSNPAFKCWEGTKSLEKRVLFLNGSPGSGKSTLAKKIIYHQKRKQASQSLRQSFLAYFFFKHDAADRRTARSMLQYLIMQLVNADETVMRFVYDRLSTMESAKPLDLKKLANDCFTSRSVATLVLDGLDEAMDKEHKASVNWCWDLLQVADSCGCDVKILICGQRDGQLDALLSIHPQIRLDTVDAHKHDIEIFTKGQAAKIRRRFLLTQREEESLVFKISTASQGMLLYARVVLDSLAAMDSIQEFEDELECDSFPKDLDQAYDRIARRILKQHGPSRHQTVKKILGWVICASRPLRWREIQSRFCIDAEKETCNIRSLRLDSCKSICGSLVDVANCDLFPNTESEQVVSMVHETATRYLIRNGMVDLLQEHINMALFCCQYLSSRPFTRSRSQQINDHIHSGYFGFLDYATVHYGRHIHEVEALVDSADSALGLEAIKAAAVDLTESNCQNSSNQRDQGDKGARDLSLSIQNNVLAVRTLIGLQRKKSETAVFDATEGPRRYKCHKIQCSKFAVGFTNESALEEHVAVHERPFRCPYVDCFAYPVGYASSERLESHDQAFHHSISNVVFPAQLETGEWNLYEACKAGNLNEVKRFHREGADLNGTHTKTTSPMCAAVRAGHGHICKYLVDNGTNPFSSRAGPSGTVERTPVVEAIYGERLELLEFFLHIGNGPGSADLAETIAQAIHLDRPSALEMLLMVRQPRDHVDMITLVAHQIILQHDLRLLRGTSHSIDATLIHNWFRYVKPEFYSQTGAFVAAFDCAEYNICGDILFRDANSFHRALRAGCYTFATFLMDIGNTQYLQMRNDDGEMPLHSCIRGLCQGDCISCMSVVRRLLQYDDGKFANSPDNDGKLPAYLAMCRVDSEAILRAVVEATRNINHKDNSGQSLLHVAISADQIRVLLENKTVDLFNRNRKGQTIFSALIDHNIVVDTEALNYLLDVDGRLAWTPDESKEGLTPLHHAMVPLKGHPAAGSYKRENSLKAANLLLTCPEAKRVLEEYQVKSTAADRRRVRGFAEEGKLQEALKIMDSILFDAVD